MVTQKYNRMPKNLRNMSQSGKKKRQVLKQKGRLGRNVAPMKANIAFLGSKSGDKTSGEARNSMDWLQTVKHRQMILFSLPPYYLQYYICLF